MVSNSEDLNFMVQPLSRLFLRRFASKALAVDVQLSPKKLQTAKLPNQGVHENLQLL